MENFPQSHDNQDKNYKGDILLYAMLPENKRIDVFLDIHLVLKQAVRSTRNSCDGEEKGRFYCAQNEGSVVNNLTRSREVHNFPYCLGQFYHFYF